ncbi:MAG: DUF1016 N-terminal domain-containing protein [Promicromonosporaceae bacterium]|nr:DUF1016 N-terminal domain-containing protein [Promicromonosporaceae bacterium]
MVDRTRPDLRREFPDQRGWSDRNLRYMRAMAETWPDESIWPQAVAKLPWGHVRTLLDGLKTSEERDW